MLRACGKLYLYLIASPLVRIVSVYLKEEGSERHCGPFLERRLLSLLLLVDGIASPVVGNY